MDRFERLTKGEKVNRYERLARKALSAYGLEEAELSYLGTSTHTAFEVAAENPFRRYALRIAPADWSTQQIEREILWLTALCRDTDLIVPEPILAADGNLARKVGIAGVPGFRSVVVLRWIEGESRNRELGVRHLREIGRSIAALHAYAMTFRWPEELRTARRDASRVSEILDERMLEKHVDADRVDVFRRAIERIGLAMVELGSGPQVAGVIHGQLLPQHVRFEERGAGLIGFGGARWGHFLYDLATMQRVVADREKGSALVAALLEGYRSVRDLSEETAARLPAFAALRSIDRIQGLLAHAEADQADSDAHALSSEFTALERAMNTTSSAE